VATENVLGHVVEHTRPVRNPAKGFPAGRPAAVAQLIVVSVEVRLLQARRHPYLKEEALVVFVSV